jgi:hypothetical protein
VSSFADAWYADAEQQSTLPDDADARRREILFAVCFAETYLFEWARELLKVETGSYRERIFEFFPPDDGRSVSDRWKEVPRDLCNAKLIPAKPDLGGPHGEQWGKLVRHRNQLVHAVVSYPTSGLEIANGAARGSAKVELRSLEPGWALGVVVERVRRLHDAVQTPTPGYIHTASNLS